jgi:glycosyltransferase involved in cell wall biosynthesis
LLRIAQVAPPLEAVPPLGYGGTERIVGELVGELDRRGHKVTTFASGDSKVPGRHVPTVPRALRPIGFDDDPAEHFRRTIELVLAREDDFDLIHAHVDPWNLELARRARIPVVSTFHGRLDQPWARDAFRDAARGLVAVSRDQARVHPQADWTVIHHGVTFRPPPPPEVPGEDFCFVGRLAPEKGFPDAIEIARLTGRRLVVAAKRPTRPIEIDYFDAVIRPALDRADVTILGELSEVDRDALVAGSRASLVPSIWPEPFGLVVIEALSCGTPVLARRSGAIPEILRDGIDGFLGDDAQQLAFLDGRLDGLDRAAIQVAALERFSVGRMVDRYEELYARLLGS